MNTRHEMTLLLFVALLILSTAAAVAQRPTSPPPSGNRIVAQDGDVVVVENDARVKVVRRRETHMRIMFDAAERSLMLLMDHDSDGRVDRSQHFSGVEGAWPLGSRWEGRATIDEYSMAMPGPPGGWGISTPDGLVQVLHPRQEFRDPDAAAVLFFEGSSSRDANDLGFDEAEQWLIQELRRNDGTFQAPGGVSGSLSVEVTGGIAPREAVRMDHSGAVRVGGNVRAPIKIVDVRPAFPEQAARAGVRGVVIVEVIIDVDGTVKDARVLRSIPMLDAAALEAVRQWRYAPTTIADKPVPVIMTVSVKF